MEHVSWLLTKVSMSLLMFIGVWEEVGLACLHIYSLYAHTPWGLQ